MLSSAGYAFDTNVDAMALHYRHLSVSVVRQLRLGRRLEEICLDRARGYCVSRLDPGWYPCLSLVCLLLFSVVLICVQLSLS
jgi:hypothetical protein